MHITLDGLSKRFRSVVALDDVRMEIEPGQIVAVLGPNGAGKTRSPVNRADGRLFRPRDPP